MTTKDLDFLKGVQATLEMLDFDEQALELNKLILRNTPKPAKPKAPKEKPIKAIVTTGDNTMEMTFETSKAFEKWANDMVKNRQQIIRDWQRVTGLMPPSLKYFGPRGQAVEKYQRDKENYLQALEKAKLNFEIVISQ